MGKFIENYFHLNIYKHIYIQIHCGRLWQSNGLSILNPSSLSLSHIHPEETSHLICCNIYNTLLSFGICYVFLVFPCSRGQTFVISFSNFSSFLVLADFWKTHEVGAHLVYYLCTVQWLHQIQDCNKRPPRLFFRLAISLELKKYHILYQRCLVNTQDAVK